MKKGIQRTPAGRPMAALAALLTVGLMLVTVTPSAVADDLGGADQLLCASLTATRCTPDGCTTNHPSAWNIPQFIRIDLTKKMLETTVASGQNRSTPIRTLVRENGQIIIQGDEGGKAFSFVIDEASGDLNAAIATATGANVVFAVCTPLPVSR